MNSCSRFIAPLVLSCACAATANATTLIKMSTEEMTAQATDIVVGACTNTRSVWVGRSLVTLATVSVDESLKGAAAQEITVVLPGGVDANRPVPVSVTYPGAPVLSPREQVVLFLEADAPVKDGFQVVGFSQGKYSVVRDAFGKTVAAQNRALAAEAVDLEAFKARIRELVRNNVQPQRSEQ